MTKGAYTPELTPVAHPGDHIRLDYGSSQEVVRVAQYATLPEVQTKEITVADQDRERNVELDNLEMWDGWLAQYRLPRYTDQIPDDVTVGVDIGGNQMPLFETRNTRGELSNENPAIFSSFSGEDDVQQAHHLTEMYVYEDEVPRLTVENRSGSEIDLQLTFAGYKMNVQEVDDVTDVVATVPVRAIRD